MLKITKNQGSIQVTADKSGFYPFDGTITFPTNSLFTATSANTDMITFKSTSNGDVQFVGNYKDITISGRSYDTKQKFLTAFSNLANQGSVDAYTKAETDAKLDAKQSKLKAGNGITLTEDATDGTTVVKTAVSLTDNGNGAYTVGDSIGIGDRASVRIGNNNNVLQGQNSIVIGDHAMTNSEKCIAIGNSSEVNAGSTCSIVIGDSTISNGSQNIAIGDNRRCDGSKNVGIGCGKLDTVDVNGDSNVCIGENSNVHTKDNGPVNESVVIGNNARSESSYSVAIGKKAFSKQANGIAIGNGAGAEAPYNSFNSESIAIGHFARADGENSIALGYYSKGQKGGVAIGFQGKATAEKGIAIGEWALASVENGVAIGELAQTAADTPLVIRAGNKTVDGRKLPITMIQGDANGKISILKGDGTDERIVIQDEIEALKNAGGGGTVDAYTKAETDTKLDAKQDKLTAGSGITIDENNVISSTGGSGGGTNPLVNVKGTSDATITDTVTDAVAIGGGANVTEDKAVAIGSGANATSAWPLVINAGTDVNGKALTMFRGYSDGKILIPSGDGTASIMCIQDEIAALKSGVNPLVKIKGTSDAIITDTVTEAVAIGGGAKVSRDYGVSVGYQCKSGDNSVAIGKKCNAEGGYSVAIGNDAKTGTFTSNSIAIGNGAKANGSYSLAIGKGATTSSDTPMVINAISKTMIQSDANGKISLLKGDGTDERMVIQDEIAALKAEIAALKGGASTGDASGGTTGA